jgi:hypothetical protein
MKTDYYSPQGGLNIRSLGQAADSITDSGARGALITPQQLYIWRVLSIASSGLGAFHGYRRNNSVAWAVGWAILGGMFPVIVPAIAFAQGFGKPAVNRNRRRRTSR